MNEIFNNPGAAVEAVAPIAPAKTQTIFNVADFRLQGLHWQIEKLNKRARKLGVTEVAIRETGKIEVEEIKNEITGFVVERRRWIEVEIIGDAPKFAGWALAATLDHTPEGNIIRKVPDCTANLMAYKNAKPVCEHCRKARNRKDTYVVVHDDGSIKQVGHDCIKDFLGHTSPERLGWLAELWFSISEISEAEEGFEGGSGISRDRSVFVGSLLAHTARLCRYHGFISGAAAKAAIEAGRPPVETTKESVLDIMFPPKDKDAQREIAKRFCVDGEEWPTPTEADTALAESARQYVIDQLENKADLTEFENNLLVAAKCEWIEFRTCGIACYIIEYFRREGERAEKRKVTESKQATLTHFGEVGKRYRKVDLTYKGCHSFESAFGWCYIHKFDTADGSRLVWKTGTDLGYDDDAKIVATFTVKEHGYYKGWKQTKVSRVVCDCGAEITEKAN